ncbi:hypothetical protein D3C80_1692100 [compost metagenome]
MNTGNLAQMLLADKIVQAVAAQQQQLSGSKTDRSHIRLYLGIGSQRPDQYIAAGMAA